MEWNVIEFGMKDFCEVMKWNDQNFVEEKQIELICFFWDEDSRFYIHEYSSVDEESNGERILILNVLKCISKTTWGEQGSYLLQKRNFPETSFSLYMRFDLKQKTDLGISICSVSSNLTWDS